MLPDVERKFENINVFAKALCNKRTPTDNLCEQKSNYMEIRFRVPTVCFLYSLYL